MKFKRLLSGIIAATVVAGSLMTTSFASESETKSTRETEMMVGLGLMSVDENNDFHPDSPMTRAEIAELVVNIVEYPSKYDTIGGGGSFSEVYDPWEFFEGATDYTSYISDKLAKWEAENASDEETDSSDMTTSEKLENLKVKIYKDVEVNNPSYDTINKVTYYGIMNGYEDRNFKPNSYISCTEASAVIINLLGYKNVVPYCGGYPAGYGKIAGEINLSTIRSDSPITREQMAKLIAGAFGINVMKPKIYGPDIVFSSDGNHTLISEFMKLEKIEGRVVQNGQTSLTGKTSLGARGLQVDEQKLYVSEKTEYAQKLIGREVECYYFNSETDSEGEVVFARAKNPDAEITFKIEDYISYENGQIKYLVNDHKKTCKVSANPLYIYNGLAVTSCPDSYFDGEQGNVILVQNENSSVCDLIIIENYSSKFVKRAYTNGDKFTIVNTLYNNDNVTFDINEVGKNVRIYKANGENADISDIKTDMVIDVMQNDDIIEIIISEDVIYDFNLVSLDTTDGLYLYNEDGEYTVSGDYISSVVYTDLKPSMLYDVYLNSFGKIAYISGAGNESLKIGYLKSFSVYERGVSKKVYAQLVTKDKTITTYELAKKVSFSGNDGIVENKTIKPLDDFSAYLESVSNQAIRFLVNGNNQITQIELALKKGVESQSENRLYVMAESSGDDSDYTYYYANGTLGRKVYMEKETPILIVPSDTSDENKYRILNYTALSKGSRKMIAYGTNQDSPLASYVLYFDEASSSYSEGFEYVVCGVKNTQNEDGEDVIALDVSRRGVKSRFYINQSGDFADGILPISLAVKTTTQGINPDDYIKVSKGDIISCMTDTGNNITSAAVIFDADGHYDARKYKDRYEQSSGYDSDKFADFNYDFKYTGDGILAGTIGYYNQYVTNTNPFSTDYRNGPVYTSKNSAYGWHMGARRFLLGYVYSVADNYVTITTKNLRELGEPIPEGKFGEQFLVESYDIGRYWNYVDISRKNITSGLLSDNPNCIRSYKEYGEKCSRVLVCSGSTAVNEVYVINENID